MKKRNKKKRAFTLIELMAVVIILGILATITVTSINYTIKNSKEKLFNEQISRLEAGAKDWSISNTNLLPTDASGISFFSIKKLKDVGVIESDSVIDPRTNEELTGCLTIKYDEGYNQYVYDYVDNDCSSVASAYQPVITINGGDDQFTEVNGVFVAPIATAKDYTGRDLIVEGPIVKKGTTIVSSVATGTVSDEYTLTYFATDDRLDLTTTKIITLTVNDTIAPTITVNGSSTSVVISVETQASFTAPTAIVTDNSCGISGTDTSKNGCTSTLVASVSGTVTPNVPGTYNITYRATDSSNNIKILIATINVVDTNAPTVPTFAIKLNTSAGATYPETWTNQSVWLGSFAATDTGSGIQRYEYSSNCELSTPTWSDAGVSQLISITTNKSYCLRAVDNYNNTSVSTRIILVKVDKTIPVCVSSGSNATWTNGSRVLTGTCTDTDSGCLTATVTKTYAVATNSTVESPGTVTDNVGNSTVCSANQTVKIDKIAPTCASSGGSASWTHDPIIITGTCSDTGGSGCSGNRTNTYSVNTNITTGTPNGTVTDLAGNVSAACPANQTVKIDTTVPTCALSGGSASWTTSNIVITGTCSDTGGSGCTGNTTNTYSTNTNITTGTSGNVTDAAGNIGVCTGNQTVKIDTIAPTCASSGGSASWTHDNITLTGTCSDAGSGCAAATVTKTYSTEINSTVESPGTVTDNVGHSTVCTNQTVKIDKTAPTCAVSGGVGAWTNQTVTLVGTCSDTGGSGCSVATVSTVYASDVFSNSTATGNVSDAAGNVTACAGQSVYVDKTAPTAPSAYLNGYASGAWTSGDVTTTLSSTDAMSGVASYQYSHDNINFSAWPANPWTITWDGQWTFYARATDAAGNVSASSSAWVLRIDKTGPVVSTSACARCGVWVNAASPTLSVSWTATDGGVGISQMQYTINQSTVYVDTSQPSGNPTSFSTSDTWGGQYGGVTFYIRAIDALGNVGAWRTIGTMYRDTVAPTFTLGYTVTSTVNCRVYATVSASSGGTSGLPAAYVSFLGGAYSSATISGTYGMVGTNPQITAKIKDGAGNVSVTKTVPSALWCTG